MLARGGGSAANVLRSLHVHGWGGVDGAGARGRSPREGVSAESMNAEHESARLVSLKRRKLDTELAVWGSLVLVPAGRSPIAWLRGKFSGPGGADEDGAKRAPDLFGRHRAGSGSGCPRAGMGGCHTSVAYLRIMDFNTRTVGELKEVVKQIREEAGSPGVGFYAVDLRDNMGGLLSAAIQVPLYRPSSPRP